jgi:Mannosyl-glycoprotein endo-beta-N-acetylglucosaminidase/Large polyvalent protein-associated domain 1
MSTPGADPWAEFQMDDAPPPPVGSLTPLQMAFVQKMWPHAEAAGKVLGVDPRAIIAQAALETGWGASMVKDQSGASSNNMFNIKPGTSWAGPQARAMTTEYTNGVPAAQQAAFRSYGSAAESTADYARLLQNPRYAAARGTGDDYQSFGSALQAGGYATDPEYGNKIASIAATLPALQSSTDDPYAEFIMDDAQSQAAPQAEPRRVSAPWVDRRSFTDAFAPPAVPDVQPGQSEVGPYQDAYSIDSPYTRYVESPDENMQTIEVSGRPQPREPQPIDPRLRPWEKSSAESTWGETIESMLPMVGGQVAQWMVGAKELWNDIGMPEQRLDLLRTLVIPDAFKRFQANKAAAGGEEFKNDMFNDPAIVKAAQLAGMPVARFLLHVEEYAGLTPQEQAAKLGELMPAVAARGQRAKELEFERLSNDVAIEGISPNVEPYTPKWAASGAAQMAPALGLMAAGAAAGGAPLALSTLAGVVLPPAYGQGKSLGLTPGKAGLFAGLQTLAELAPELPVVAMLTHTPASQALLKKAFGRWASTAAAKASGVGTFEAFSEGLTSILQDLTKAGLLNQSVTLGQLGSNAAQNAVLGFLPGTAIATPGSIKQAGVERAAANEKKDTFTGPRMPEQESKFSDALEAVRMMNQLGMNARGAPTTQAARQADVAEAVSATQPTAVPQVFPPQAATMEPPRATGSRAPEPGAVEDSAPIPAPARETASSLQQALKEGTTYQAPDGPYTVVAVSPDSDPDKHLVGMRGPDGSLRPWSASEFAAHIERASGADERQTQRQTQLEETAKKTAETAKQAAHPGRAKKYADLSSALRRPTPVPKEVSDEKALLLAMAQMHAPEKPGAAKEQGERFDALVKQVIQPATRGDVENFATLSSKLREPKQPEPEKSDAEKIASAMADMKTPATTGINQLGETFRQQVADIGKPEEQRKAASPAATAAPTEPAPTPVPQAAAVSTTQQPAAGAATPSTAETEEDPFAPKEAPPRPTNASAPLAQHEQQEVNDIADKLRGMATQAGWYQMGGKRLKVDPSMMADADKPGSGGPSPTTKWLAHAEWWHDVQNEVPLRGNNAGEATRRAVEKSIAGEPITPTEYKHIKAMVAVVRKFEKEAEALGIREFDPMAGTQAASEQFGDGTTRADIIDTALVEHAASLDEVGVERAAIQNEGNDQGFMDAIRGIIATHEQATKTGKSGTALPGTQGAQPAAGEGQPVLTPSPGPPAQEKPVKPAQNQGELLPKDEKAQALADAQRAKDEGRSPGTQVSPGVGGGLFSDEQKQTDLTDDQTDDQTEEPAQDDEVTTLDEDVGTSAAEEELADDEEWVDEDQEDQAADGSMQLRRVRVKKKKAKPSSAYSETREPGMTSSHMHQIWTENNLDPKDMEVLSPEQKLAKAKELLKARFGFKSIDVATELNVGEAIDIVKDAYAGLSNFANIQNMAPQVMSLNGWLKLSLVRRGKGGALASYHPVTHTITMTRRNDAFAHEWAHALDNYLLIHFAPDVALVKGLLLTGKIRRGGEPQTLDAQVTQALIDVVNAMFFDKAKAALHVQMLQQKIAAAPTPSQKAAAQTQLDNFLRGSGRPAGAESTYYKAAVASDRKPMEDEDPKSYWQRPTEMWARAFEAYIAHKLAGYDAAHPFVTDSDRMYQKGRNGQFNALYPQAIERQAIFDAIDVLMRAVRDRGLVQVGNTNQSNLIDATAPSHWKQQVPSLTPVQAKQARSVWQKVKEALKQRREENLRDEASDRSRAEMDKKTRDSHLNAAAPGKVRRYFWNMGLAWANGWNSFAAAKFTSIQSFMLSVAEKNIGNAGIEQIRAWFAPDPGAARGVQKVSFERVVSAEIKRLTNKFATIVRDQGMFEFTDDELRNVRDVIVGAEKATSNKTRDAAAAIIEFNNDMHVYMDEAGLDVGYVRENGWMKRVMDPQAVEDDIPKFRERGRKVYESVYDEEIGTMNKLTNIDELGPLNSLLRYVKEIAEKGAVPQARQLAAAQDKLAKDVVAAHKALAKDPQNPQLLSDFQDAVYELREAMREPWAMEALHDWEMHIRGMQDKVERFQIEARGPEGSFTKSRRLPALADELLGDFMITNPLQLTQTYIDQVVRRVQFGKFFGEETSKKPLGWKLSDALAEATQEYTGPDGKVLRADPDDLEELQLSIDTILRQGSRGFLSKRQLRKMAAFNAYLLPVFLARSIAAQIAEPFVVGWRTGNIMDGLHVFHSQMQDVAAWLGHQPSQVKAQWRREMSNYAGITTDHLADHLINNRYNLMFQDVGSAKKLARFFMISGIQPHAMSMRRGAADVMLTRYLPSMAKRAMGTGPKARQAREALQEIGIPISTEVLNDIVKLENIRSVADLAKLPNFQLIRMAAVTLVDQAILDPKIMHKPRWASQPEMSYMYGIMAMNFAFQREVIQASSKRIVAAWKNNPKIGTATTASVLASAGLLASGQFSMWVLRQMLWAHDDWDEIEKKMKEEGLIQAASRSGYFGAFDPVLNAFMSVRYDRDLTNLTAGALRGSVLAGVQSGINLFGERNSPNTASAEKKATEALWNLGVTPLLTSLILKHIAGKFPAADAALGVGLTWLGSGYVSQNVAESIAEGVTGKPYTNKIEKRKADAGKRSDRGTERRARDKERNERHRR